MNKKTLRRYLGNQRQLGGVRRFVLDDDCGRGMRVIEVNNGSGLIFNVYPDRGMDIGEVFFNGRQLAWLPGSAPGAPAFYNERESEWLRSWGGGLLTGCGYLNVGPAENGEGLHGRLSHIPAGEVNSSAEFVDDVTFVTTVSGKVSHCKVFSENLLLTRKITSVSEKNSIVIEDTIENCGFTTQPLMILNHMNFGWPLVDENCYLEAAEHQVAPRNVRAAEGIDRWNIIEVPQEGFQEQVYFHSAEPCDAENMASMAIVNPASGLKVTVKRSVAELPFLIEWKQMGCGNYVLGIEPANCHPVGKDAFEKQGLLRNIAPGEIVKTKIKVVFEAI
ncbi:MAG: aldose 1-epimerase family protein [Lentisphaeria bacterium]|nr:aldose 1-epimerase family protein [Lentisphaeria bacterium]